MNDYVNDFTISRSGWELHFEGKDRDLAMGVAALNRIVWILSNRKHRMILRWLNKHWEGTGYGSSNPQGKLQGRNAG